MGRAPCCDKANVKKGPWSPEEDSKLKEFIEKYGTGGNWIALPQKAGLKRCGKSCRLRWLNYLRPNIKHGDFSEEEDRIICTLFATIGSRWSIIAGQLPGRTDNDIKNYWNTKLKKKLMANMHPEQNHLTRKPQPHLQALYSQLPSPPPPPPPQPTTTTLYTDFTSCYNNPNKPLTALEQPFLPPNLMNNSFSYNPSNLAANFNSSLINQAQEGLANSMQYYPGVKDSSFIMFGGDQPSCSSSDGSCSQMSNHGREMKQEDTSALQGLIANGFEANQSTSHLEYEIEEIKQLISSGTGVNDGGFSSSSFPLSDESKEQQAKRSMA
ncbi:unnamed protein product, partial [Thlaspi arvense]